MRKVPLFFFEGHDQDFLKFFQSMLPSLMREGYTTLALEVDSDLTQTDFERVLGQGMLYSILQVEGFFSGIALLREYGDNELISHLIPSTPEILFSKKLMTIIPSSWVKQFLDSYAALNIDKSRVLMIPLKCLELEKMIHLCNSYLTFFQSYIR